MKSVLEPKIEVFSPFVRPFSKTFCGKTERISSESVVSTEVVQYMSSGQNLKIVAKCTPCQCCACR